MKTITFDEIELGGSSAPKQINKARAIILNDEQELFISNYAGCYLLPGGKLDSFESFEDALIREINEELGIALNHADLTPFLCVEQIIKNYLKNDDFGTNHRHTITKYYIIRSNSCLNSTNIVMSEAESKHQLKTFRIGIEGALKLTKENPTENSRNAYYQRELVVVLNELKKHLGQT